MGSQGMDPLGIWASGTPWDPIAVPRDPRGASGTPIAFRTPLGFMGPQGSPGSLGDRLDDSNCLPSAAVESRERRAQREFVLRQRPIEYAQKSPTYVPPQGLRRLVTALDHGHDACGSLDIKGDDGTETVEARAGRPQL